MWAWTWRVSSSSQCISGRVFLFFLFSEGKKGGVRHWGCVVLVRHLWPRRFMWLWKGSRFIFLRKVTDSYTFGEEGWRIYLNSFYSLMLYAIDGDVNSFHFFGFNKSVLSYLFRFIGTITACFIFLFFLFFFLFGVVLVWNQKLKIRKKEMERAEDGCKFFNLIIFHIRTTA